MKQYLLYILLWIQAITALPSLAQAPKPASELSQQNAPAIESSIDVAPRLRAQAEQQAIVLRIDNFVNTYNARRLEYDVKLRHMSHDHPSSGSAAPAYVPQASAALNQGGGNLADQAAEIGADIGRQIGSAIGSAIAGQTLGGRVGETVGVPIGTAIGRAIGGAIDSFLQGQGI